MKIDPTRMLLETYESVEDRYLDDPPDTASDTFDVIVRLRDDAGTSDTGNVSMTVTNLPPVVEAGPNQETLTHRYTYDAVEFIHRNRTRPFFLYFAHMYVHVPLFPPKEFLERSRNGPYGAEVECIDWSTGVILDTLADLGLDDNTLVVFTSDNGTSPQADPGFIQTSSREGWEKAIRQIDSDGLDL